eukprot:COSAG04_NODE_1484_length_6561_cov_1.862272_9_plen_82_part_00
MRLGLARRTARQIEKASLSCVGPVETLSTHSATGVTAQPGEKSRLQAAALTCAMKKGAFIVVLERNWIVAFMAMALPGVAD